MTGLISLQSKGILKSLLQHHSSTASVLLCSAFFIDLLSHPCMTIGKTIALTIWTFVGKGPKVLFKDIVSKGTFQNKNSLVVQWSGLRAFTAMGLGLILGQGAKNPQTRWCRRKKMECMVSKSCNSRGEGLGDRRLSAPSVENWLVLPLSGLRL